MSSAWFIMDRNTWFGWHTVVIADSEDEARQLDEQHKDKDSYLCIPLPHGTVIGTGGDIPNILKIIADSGERTFNKCRSYGHGKGPTGMYDHCSCPKSNWSPSCT